MDARVTPAHDEEMPDAKLIGLDWGTTSRRAYLIGADSTVLDRQLDGPGILKVENGHFGPWLDSMIGGWTAAHWPRAADPLRHDRLAAGLEGRRLMRRVQRAQTTS